MMHRLCFAFLTGCLVQFSVHGVAHATQKVETKSDGPPATASAPVSSPEAVVSPPAQPAGTTPTQALLPKRLPSTWLVDDGRRAVPPPSRQNLSFLIRGALQVRVRGTSELPLMEPLSASGQDTLGQRVAMHQWIRTAARLRYRDRLELMGELDLLHGMALGDRTQLVDAARDDDAVNDFEPVRLRQLYLQYTSPIGLFRLGQQTSHWGMGLLANDGHHATTFGDYRRGTVVERALFATRPLGPSEPLELMIGGDLVFEDARARLLDGDRALQGVVALRWTTDRLTLGIYGVSRDQRRLVDTTSASSFQERLNVQVFDAALSFNAPIPSGGAFVFGDMEVAMVRGSTTTIRQIDQTRAGLSERIASYGGAARLGVAKSARRDGQQWSDIKVAMEWGYASGDADPADGVSRRFTFDQNHNVGLILFDHVMAWKSARAATLAADSALVNRPAAGSRWLPSEGGVFGATYVYPTAVFRPRHWLDLKLGAVIAQTTSDWVDPYRYGSEGNYRNYEGGDPTKHDLGVELDAGVDVRLPLGRAVRLHLGAEGGVFFPGGAFDDEQGEGLPQQYLVNGKLGLHY